MCFCVVATVNLTVELFCSGQSTMASSSSNKTSADLYGVEIVVDEKSHKKYKKGKFLGKVRTTIRSGSTLHIFLLSSQGWVCSLL